MSIISWIFSELEGAGDYLGEKLQLLQPIMVERNSVLELSGKIAS